MDQMKYIIVKGSHGLELPFIFAANISHADMARKIINPHGWDTEQEFKDNIYSAGFVVLTDKGLECYGKSHTLNIGTQKIDSKLINRMLGKRIA